jgi:hypothetical protein
MEGPPLRERVQELWRLLRQHVCKNGVSAFAALAFQNMKQVRASARGVVPLSV